MGASSSKPSESSAASPATQHIFTRYAKNKGLTNERRPAPPARKPRISKKKQHAFLHFFNIFLILPSSFAVRAVSQCLLEEWNICNGERAGPGVEVEACANWPRKDSDTPVRFSQGVLDGLQGSGEVRMNNFLHSPISSFISEQRGGNKTELRRIYF
jgi:hypothetical protein